MGLILKKCFIFAKKFNWYWAGTASLVIFYAFFLKQSPLWLDEAGSYYYISRGSLKSLIYILTKDTGLPFYYILLFYWAKLFSFSEIALRSLSYLFYVADIVVAYILAKKLLKDNSVAQLSALLLAASAYVVNQATDARMYTLLLFLTMLSMYLAYTLFIDKSKITQTARRLLLGCWLLVNTLGLYTHYWFLIMLLAQGIILLLLQRNRSFILNYLGSFILYLPWAKTMTEHLANSSYSTHWLTPPNLFSIIETFVLFLSIKRTLGLVLLVVLSCLILVFRKHIYKSYRRDQQRLNFLFYWLGGIIIIGFLISQFKPIYYPIRYLIVAFPPFILLLAWLLNLIKRQNLKVFLIIIFVAVSFLGFWQQKLKPDGRYLSDRTIAERIVSLNKQKAPVVFTGYSRATLEYYLRTQGFRFSSFPDEQQYHPAWYSLPYYLQDQKRINAEVKNILNENKSLLLVLDEDAVSRQLWQALNMRSSPKVLQEVNGRYCQKIIFYGR